MPTVDVKPHFWGLRWLWARLLLVAALYGATGWVSVHFTVVDNGPSMLWLPNGVMLAALLMSPRRHWLAYVALLLPLELWVDWDSYSLRQSLGFAGANALEVLLAAWTLRRICGPAFSLHRLAHIGWFVVAGPVLSSGLAALLGTELYGTHPSGLGWGGHWLVWWLGDSLGLLVLTPLLVDLWGPRATQDHARLLRSTSWWPATAILLVMNGLVFGQARVGLHSPVLSAVLVLPAVAWIALRHGPVGGAWASLWTAVIAIALTGQSAGPYAAVGSVTGGLLLQEYLLVMSMASLGLGALLAEVRRRERTLRVFQRAVESLDDGIVIADARQPDQPVIYVNQKFEASTGYAPSEVLGRNCRFLSGSDRAQPGLAQLRDALQREMPVQVLLRNYRKNGEMFWNQLTLAPVVSPHNGVTHFVGVQHDITELKRTQDALLTAKEALEAHNRELEERVLERTQALELLSTTDALTGTRNRRHLMEQATREMARAQRYGRPLSCLLFDIDHFKRINDNHGHAAGDRMLVALCQTVQAMLRPADTLARFGGEEFVVLLPDTDAEHARQAAERLREQVEQTEVPVPGEASPLRLTISVGVATLSVLNADVDALFRAADAAMYRAKTGGRNRVEVSPD
ncbi:sensor domain-containing diguanylate cyclase [Hydrogenophaga sp. OTU3427]|uniref:sensor domain-containing diguanylate cyclase n=1 Tax=Hydrogenophaga sp. OTU3427 TaxID=3043856 RepID=UPI00313DA551